MSRPIYSFRTLSLVMLVAGFAAGCTSRTVYTAMYTPQRSYFVAPVEKQVAATELPPVTTTTTTTTLLPTTAPVVEPAPAFVPDAAQPAPALPGMEATPGMEAAPAPGMEAAPAPAPGMETPAPGM